MRLLQATILTLFIFLQSGLFAQTDEFLKFKSKYPDEREVIMNKKQSITLDIVDGKLVVFTEYITDEIILGDQVVAVEEQEIGFSGWSEIEIMEAYTLTPSKSKYKKVPASSFNTKDEFSSGIFHSDAKTTTFHFTDLSQGAIKHLKYKRTLKEPRFLDGPWFASHLPIENMSFEVKCHEDIQIGHKIFNLDEKNYTYSSHEKKGYKYYSWKLSEVDKIKPERNTPNFKYYLPHIEVFIKHYATNEQDTKLIDTPKELHQWYYSLVKDVNQTITPQLEQIADSLASTQPSSLGKVKAVYYWVQNNIRYVAFEDGLGGFVPREAGLVCDRRFGDCKDMASIITGMLNHLNLDAHLTWIGTRDIPYTYTEMPTPSVDNHMIASYEENGTTYFLDATSSNLPFGMPSGFIQGKEAMINLENGEFKIVPVPEVTPDKNVYQENIVLNIDGRSLKGNSTCLLRGYHKSDLTHKLKAKDQSQTKKFLRSFLEKGSNKFLVEKFKVDNLEDKDRATTINYDFAVNDYVTATSDEIYVNLNLEKILSNAKLESDRQYPYEIDYKNTYKFNVLLEAPEGYEIDYVPENSDFQHDLFGYKMSYTKSSDKVLLDFTLTRNFLLLHNENFKDFNDFVAKLLLQYNEVVTLKKAA